MNRTETRAATVLERPSSPLRVHRRLAAKLIQRALCLAQSIREEGGSSARDLKRTLHLMIDLMEEDESAFLCWVHQTAAQARAKDLGSESDVDLGRDAEAAVRVTLLSLVLANAARLGRVDRALVGHATFLLALQESATSLQKNVQSPASPQWNPSSFLRRHGAYEGSVLAALLGLEEEVASTAGKASSSSLLGRILQITTRYEQLIRRDLDPCRALVSLVDQAGCDTLLLKLFVGALGPYPPGTTVLLRSGEAGVVQRSSRDPKKLDRPLIRLLFDRDGQPLDTGTDIDLSIEPGPTDLEPQILRSLDLGSLRPRTLIS